jgi:hypothetical protein
MSQDLKSVARCADAAVRGTWPSSTPCPRLPLAREHRTLQLLHSVLREHPGNNGRRLLHFGQAKARPPRDEADGDTLPLDLQISGPADRAEARCRDNAAPTHAEKTVSSVRRITEASTSTPVQYLIPMTPWFLSDGEGSEQWPFALDGKSWVSAFADQLGRRDPEPNFPGCGPVCAPRRHRRECDPDASGKNSSPGPHRRPC